MREARRRFKYLSALRNVEVIARGRGVRVRRQLQRLHGGQNWRKMKGIARIEDDHGWIGDAEIHWFEAHGVGKVGEKIAKRFLA